MSCTLSRHCATMTIAMRTQVGIILSCTALLRFCCALGAEISLCAKCAPRTRQKKNFSPVTFTKSITRNAHVLSHHLVLWIFRARMPCSHREDISLTLSHGMLFLAVASSVTDLNYLLNRVGGF